ncbi:MAG: class I SAM-dependent methyltransferase [Pseudomonadota bacterium]
MADKPYDTELHAGGEAAWDMSDDGIAYIKAHVGAGSTTLETGAGATSLMFLEQGADHHAVTPSETERDLITAEAERRGLDASKLTFHLGYSQDVLPRLDLGAPLDFVLIDGGHGFPIPAVDWLYTAPMLKVGGIMMVDDVDLWTGAMLVDFMDAEACWTKRDVLRGRTAVFELTSPFELHEWTKQPHVVAKSKWPQRMRKARNVAGLVAKGEFATIRSKMAHEKRLAEAAKDDY